MPIYLKQSTASQEVPLGFFLDSTDGDTEETGLTIANTDIKIWKTGATTLANKNSGGATHISNGVYYAVLDATDTDTLGPLVIFCHPSGALAVRVECVVLAANVYDSLIGGGDNLEVDTTLIEGTDATDQINAAVDTALDTAIPGSPTTDSINERIAAIDDKLPTKSKLMGSADADGGFDTEAKADINAEVVDTLATDTYSELGSVPVAASTLADKINWLFALARNKITSDSTTITLRDDGDAADIATSTQSDNGTTYTRGEWS